MLQTESQWLLQQNQSLTDEIPFLLPSEWAEQNRYLPSSVTTMSGYFDWNVTPYFKEILDCLSPYSPVRIVDLMKGVQIGATVAILENAIGYGMAFLKTSPMSIVTADRELAQIRMESYVTPMIENSGLSHLIRSSDSNNQRKTGKTDRKLEWEGGGFLIPLGAQNANKFRSVSFEILLLDEIDTYPQRVGKDGRPDKLVFDRTAAFEATRKVFRVSTPLIDQTSIIKAGWKLGDQREYRVPCKHCGERQKLVQYGVNKSDGTVYGIDYELQGDQILVEGSVRYICRYCQGEMINDDKVVMLENGLWVPTATPISKDRRSYQISSFYSPPGMQTWDALVLKWLECWDIKRNIPRDIDLMQLYYNNVLGETFKVRSTQIKYDLVIQHRRNDYVAGMIPNKLAIKETGAKIQLLTCAVDVHKRHLDVHVIGWVRGRGFYSIEWLVLEGDCEKLDDSSWEALRDLILDKEYVDEEGFKYRPQLTLIDSGYNSDMVYEFCNEFTQGVHPIVGRESPIKNAAMKEFSQFESKLGIPAFNITTTIYKDRLQTALKKEWDFIGPQPTGYPNFPADYPDRFFKQLTVEQRRQKINQVTGQIVGHFWYTPPNAENHSWDLTVYNSAALDMIVMNICTETLGIDQIDYKAFWDFCELEILFIEQPKGQQKMKFS